MKRTRHSPELIVTKLHQAATELAGRKTIEEVCKSQVISPATYHRWQEQYGGADVNTIKFPRLHALLPNSQLLRELPLGQTGFQAYCQIKSLISRHKHGLGADALP